MRELSLFTGAGGGVLGTKLLGWTTLGYVEFNEYCQKVLSQRIKDGILDEAPIFTDIRAFISEGYAASYTGMVDVITAGFPCQPFSVAGKQQGENDPRNMWPQTIECIRIIRPQFALLENVPGLLAHPYARRIFGDLAESGYDARWRVLSAAEVGAPHKRDRIWIVANTSGTRAGDFPRKIGTDRRRGVRGDEQTLRQAYGAHGTDRIEPASCTTGDVANSEGGESGKPSEWQRRESVGGGSEEMADTNAKLPSESGGTWTGRPELDNGSLPGGIRDYSDNWPVEPDVGRVAHGVANRVDRLKALGNGQVSRVVATAWEILSADLKI